MLCHRLLPFVLPEERLRKTWRDVEFESVRDLCTVRPLLIVFVLGLAVG